MVFPEFNAIEAISAEARHEVADGDGGDARSPAILFKEHGVDVNWAVVRWHAVSYTQSGFALTKQGKQENHGFACG